MVPPLDRGKGTSEEGEIKYRKEGVSSETFRQALHPSAVLIRTGAKGETDAEGIRKRRRANVQGRKKRNVTRQ